MNKEELINRLSNFLENFHECTGGWVKPSKDDFQEYYDIIEAIRDLKWARDEDNDPTVEISLVDRSYGRRPWMPIVPYLNCIRDESLTEDKLRAHFSAVTTASSIIEYYMRIIEHPILDHIREKNND